MKGAQELRFALLALFVCLCQLVTVLAGPPLQIETEGGSVIHKLNKQFGPRNRFNFDIEPKFRLPGQVIPLSYNIAILPILNEAPPRYVEWTTQGEVTIVIQVVEATNQIQLHKDHSIVKIANLATDVSLTKSGSGDVVQINTQSEDTATDIWTLQLAAVLPAGEEYVLKIRFTGGIPVGRTGLYRADYRDENGNQKWLATTQFETIGFRKMCPGFDEPHFKATFTISVGHSARHTALGNSAVKTTSTDPTYPDLPTGLDYKWTNFNETVRMSSYLIALVVSEYTPEFADEAILGKPVGIYGPEHLMKMGGGKWAANTSARLLKAFEGEYLEPYAMHKMDSIAIPREWFEFGAMENYGLNTYRDNLLLHYEGVSLESERYTVASILAHELAHQWFGNLVTCSWWSNIWLNEGFATYVSFFGVQEVAPEYDDQNTFLYDAVHGAQLFDAGGSSHPVINTAFQQEVADMTIFDGISYDKGSSLIRMMEGFMTRPVLKQGLQEYLQDRIDNPVAEVYKYLKK